MGRIITGYKGFDRDFTCRGFQYEVGKTYEIDGEPKLCERGFHFCTSPLAVFQFYDPIKRFAIVEADEDDVILEAGNNFCKAVTRRITIVAELALEDIIHIQYELALRVDPLFKRGETCILGGEGATHRKSTLVGYGHHSIIGVNAILDYYVSNAGNESAAVAAGTCRAAAEVNGVRSVAVVTGNNSIAESLNESSLAVATSIESVAISSMEASAAVATCNNSVAIGERGAMAMCTGFGSVAMAKGGNSLAVAAGENCSASGVLGSWLVLVQRECGQIIDVKTVKVDGATIKEGVRYELYYGNIREV